MLSLTAIPGFCMHILFSSFGENDIRTTNVVGVITIIITIFLTTRLIPVLEIQKLARLARSFDFCFICLQVAVLNIVFGVCFAGDVIRSLTVPAIYANCIFTMLVDAYTLPKARLAMKLAISLNFLTTIAAFAV